MSYYLKISYVSENEKNGIKEDISFCDVKDCPSFKEVYIPFSSDNPREVSLAYKKLFEIFKCMENKEYGCQMLYDILKKGIS